MALKCLAGSTDVAGRLTLVVPEAEALFRRLRAGESYTMASLWDGRSFEIVDPCGAHVIVDVGSADGIGRGVAVRLPTSTRDLDERIDWYSKIGFVLEDEIEGPDGDEYLLVAGPAVIRVVEAAQSARVPIVSAR